MNYYYCSLIPIILFSFAVQINCLPAIFQQRHQEVLDSITKIIKGKIVPEIEHTNNPNIATTDVITSKRGLTTWKTSLDTAFKKNGNDNIIRFPTSVFGGNAVSRKKWYGSISDNQEFKFSEQFSIVGLVSYSDYMISLDNSDKVKQPYILYKFFVEFIEKNPNFSPINLDDCLYFNVFTNKLKILMSKHCISDDNFYTFREEKLEKNAYFFEKMIRYSGIIDPLRRNNDNQELYLGLLRADYQLDGANHMKSLLFSLLNYYRSLSNEQFDPERFHIVLELYMLNINEPFAHGLFYLQNMPKALSKTELIEEDRYAYSPEKFLIPREDILYSYVSNFKFPRGEYDYTIELSNNENEMFVVENNDKMFNALTSQKIFLTPYLITQYDDQMSFHLIVPDNEDAKKSIAYSATNKIKLADVFHVENKEQLTANQKKALKPLVDKYIEMLKVLIKLDSNDINIAPKYALRISRYEFYVIPVITDPGIRSDILSDIFFDLYSLNGSDKQTIKKNLSPEEKKIIRTLDNREYHELEEYLPIIKKTLLKSLIV